ncbi:MAG: phage holin family protein [Verrucomicrobia bacterium]|nr:phage holin family protein [Verrucomicrobiota bacterium]MBS0647460.1 phage holin family protein [Verrucomicrobiota bacterium]
MRFFLSLILTTIAVYVLGHILPGVSLSSFGTAFIVAVLLRIVNVTLRPVLFILTLPFNVLTFGLFSFVIMGLMVWLVSSVVPGFEILNFWWAIIFACLLVALNGVLSLLSKLSGVNRRHSHV